MDLGINGLRVLVTAGGGGIGRVVAEAFASEGARVHVCDVDRNALSSLKAANAKITQSVTDVSDRGQVAKLFDDALGALGGIDVLVNNAGIAGPTGKVEDIPPEEWDRCLAINITGQYNCARLAVPHLRASQNASMICVSSLAGRLGFALRTPYAASKWAVIGLMKSLAIELGADGIRVNAILPGVVEGDRQARVLQSKAQARGVSFAEVRDEALAAVSMHTMVTPQQLADMMLFLASPRGRTISGQSLSICGDTQMLA